MYSETHLDGLYKSIVDNIERIKNAKTAPNYAKHALAKAFQGLPEAAEALIADIDACVEQAQSGETIPMFYDYPLVKDGLPQEQWIRTFVEIAPHAKAKVAEVGTLAKKVVTERGDLSRLTNEEVEVVRSMISYSTVLSLSAAYDADYFERVPLYSAALGSASAYALNSEAYLTLCSVSKRLSENKDTSKAVADYVKAEQDGRKERAATEGTAQGQSR